MDIPQDTLQQVAALKSSQLGILRPLSEMPETVPDGCIAVTGGKDLDRDWTLGDYADRLDTHFAILRLPAAEATPPAEQPRNKNRKEVQSEHATN